MRNFSERGSTGYRPPSHFNNDYKNVNKVQNLSSYSSPIQRKWSKKFIYLHYFLYSQFKDIA